MEENYLYIYVYLFNCSPSEQLNMKHMPLYMTRHALVHQINQYDVP